MQPQTAFSTLGCPDWSFQDLIWKGLAAGFDGVEIRLLQRQTDLLAHPDLQPSRLADRRQELDDAGFRICGLSSSVNFHDPSPAVRQQQVDIGRQYVDLAKALGAEFVRVFGDVLQPSDDQAHNGSVPLDQVFPDQRRRSIGQVADGLQSLGEYAALAGLSVLIETHGDFASSAVLRDALDRVDCEAVGVLWDTHHPWRFFGEPLAATFERLRPWIRHTHWKDSVRRPETAVASTESQTAHRLMSGHRHADYVLFRGGEFPALECMSLLKNAGYAGWYCYEWEVAWHPELEPPEIALPLFPSKLHELWQMGSRPD